MEFTSLRTLTDRVLDLSIEFQYHGDGNYGILPFYGCSIFLAGSKTKVGNLTLRVQPSYPNPQEVEQLLYEGNIGYGIFTPYRGRGYAGRACKIATELAKSHGLTELLINCNINNHSSLRVIEKLGGERVCEFDTPAGHLDENDITPRRVQYRWRFEEKGENFEK